MILVSRQETWKRCNGCGIYSTGQGQEIQAWPLGSNLPSLSFSLSVDWMRSTHIIEGNMFYLETSDLKVNYIYKTFPAISRTVF